MGEKRPSSLSLMACSPLACIVFCSSTVSGNEVWLSQLRFNADHECALMASLKDKACDTGTPVDYRVPPLFGLGFASDHRKYPIL